MSRYSGKYDFFDLVCSCKMHEVPEGYVSDLLEAFEDFKKRTGGVIYQHVRIKEVNERNHDFIKDHCKEFKIFPQENLDPDKRYKCGFKEIITYIYEYYGKKYSAKAINKNGVYITKEIHFNTLLDLIPYFPHMVSAHSSNNGKDTVFISNENYVDREEINYMQEGLTYDAEYYRKELASLYLEVCKNYFLYDLENRERTFEIKLDKERDGGIEFFKKDENGNYLIKIPGDIDYMHELEWGWQDGKVHQHWISPEMVDEITIRLHKEDVEHYLKEDIASGKVFIKYVVKPKNGFPLHIN